MAGAARSSGSSRNSGNSSTRQGDDELLREIRERYQSYSQFWADNYKLGDQDMACLSAKYGPWDAEQIKRREDAQRPICHVDIVSQYGRRIKNQGRLNPRGIVVTPKGPGATDDTATDREDRIRQIDYESMATHCRQNGLDNAVDRGIGFWMVTTDWTRADSFDQNIGTRLIANPKSVLVDPYAEKPDWSDIKGAFVLKNFEWGAYRKRFKDAAIRNFADEYMRIDGAGPWLDEKRAQVAEYWRVQSKERTLLLLSMPEGQTTHFLDEFEGGKLIGKALNWNGSVINVLKQRKTEISEVCQYITNGLEILERKPWVGSTIPIIVLTGLRKYENGKLVIESATRKMTAGQMLYDYAWTALQETFGLLPKPKYKAVIGQTEDFPEWDDAHRDPVAVLRYRARTTETGEQPLGAPEFEHNVPDIGPYINALTEAQQAVQQAAGMFSVQSKRKEDASGVAIEKLNTEQDLGNYHFSDYLDLAIQYEGRIKNEILRHIEDTDTIRGFRKEDDKYERKQVTPLADPETGEVTEHPYGKGRDHDVIVKAGPSMQSQWDKASDFLDLLAENPQYAPLVMDLVVIMKQLGPMGKKLAERFETLLPPDLRAKEKGEAPPIPAEVQQQIQKLEAALNDAMAQLDEFKAKKAELETKERMNQDNNDTKVAVAEIASKQKMLADDLSAFMLKVDRVFDLIQQQREHAHAASQADQAALDSAQSQEADRAHQQEMAAQAAAQQPEP